MRGVRELALEERSVRADLAIERSAREVALDETVAADASLGPSLHTLSTISRASSGTTLTRGSSPSAAQLTYTPRGSTSATSLPTARHAARSRALLYSEITKARQEAFSPMFRPQYESNNWR